GPLHARTDLLKRPARPATSGHSNLALQPLRKSLAISCQHDAGPARQRPMDIDPVRSSLISVVVPLFKEGANVHPLLAGITTGLAKTGYPFELILVDDGSPDDTWKVISEEAQVLPSVRGFRLSRNFGKELALCAGLERARGNIVIVMDGDGQHPPALLPDMVRLWQTTGADIVEAFKISRGRESLSGKLGALLFYVILNKLAGFNLK